MQSDQTTGVSVVVHQSTVPRVAVVIPCFRVTSQIAAVIAGIGAECIAIYAVDDACPEHSGKAAAAAHDPRVRVILHEVNQGVGGAMITGYRAALADGMNIIVKIDGDGQMDPSLIPKFITPIINGRADYVKGNRFYNIEDVKSMPRTRWIGNLALSFLTKLSSGYWSLFDPNNGYVAIDSRALAVIPLDKLSKRYFFESDMLFRLNILRAAVLDMPMKAVYEDEISSLKPFKMIPHFMKRHIINFTKRLFYSYFLRDFSVASIQLLVGTILMIFGLLFGATTWIVNSSAGVVSTSGTVMLSVLPILTGLQFLLAFTAFDMANAPSEAVGPLIDEPPPRAPFY